MDANSTKAVDFSILLRLIAQRQKKKNCKYRRQFFKSVQVFFTQKRSVLHFGTDHFLKLLFSSGVFFDYSDANIDILFAIAEFNSTMRTDGF